MNIFRELKEIYISAQPIQVLFCKANKALRKEKIFM